MISFFLTLLRLFRGLRKGFKDPQFRSLGIFVLFLLLSGTIFYNQIEHWSYLDAFYFSVTTLTTVGLGDLAPKTDLGKIFTIIYIFIGVGTLLSFITILAAHTQSQDPISAHLGGLNRNNNKAEEKKKEDHDE
ncbi:MAG: potassium channel family protein [Candidatus Levyibacteriota bacterium]